MWHHEKRLIILTALGKIRMSCSCPGFFFFFFCYSVEVYKRKTTSPLYFWCVPSSNCQWSHTENQGTLRSSQWPTEVGHVSQIMIAEAISVIFSEIITCDYGYSKETEVFQYPLKFWGNYVSGFLTLDRKKGCTSYRTSAPFFSIEIILQNIGLYFQKLFQTWYWSFFLFFHLVYIHFMYVYVCMYV